MPSKTHSPIQGSLTQAVADAREAYSNAVKAYSKARATCEAVNRAGRRLADAEYNIANPPQNSPICTGREK